MTQKEITNRCKLILNKTPFNQSIESKEDFEFLLYAFSLSPYFEMKTQGQRIVDFQKRNSKTFNTPCFFLMREDGSCTDISYSKIFRKAPKTDDVLAALRTAIDPIISKFRYSFKPFEYEGRFIERVEDADVDHYNLKFREFASIWIEENGGVDELFKKVNSTEDGCTKTYFVDEKLNEDFRAFHQLHTHLRFLPKEINRKNK